MAINGTVVTGTNGINQVGDVSECPNCTIDFYSDDLDNVGETLSYLGSTTANGSGSFAFTLSQPLASGQGIRTSSTTASSGVIGTLVPAPPATSPASTSAPFPSPSKGLPQATRMMPTGFTVRVNPRRTATPITYELTITDYNSATQVIDSSVIASNLKWTKPGLKTLTLTTAENGAGHRYSDPSDPKSAHQA